MSNTQPSAEQAASLRGGAADENSVILASPAVENAERFPRIEGEPYRYLALEAPEGGGVLTREQFDAFCTIADSMAAMSCPRVLHTVSIDKLRALAAHREDIRRELQSRERLLAGVNYRMQFFREAA